MTDRELLRRYARGGDEGAFGRIVSTHIDFVYSSARRQVNDPHLAEDVTQVTFLILARKAASLPADVVLPGWLFKTTRFVVKDMLKALRRRRQHERAAAAEMMRHDDTSTPTDGWEQLAPYLEQGLSRLRAHERDAVLLRFFRGMSMAETGSTLGISEDAAAQRISRAIKKLRQFMADKGVAVSSATALAALLSTRAVEAAPAHLPAIITSALAAGAGATPLSVAHALRAMLWAKVKVATVLAIVVLGAGGAIAFTLADDPGAAILAPASRKGWDAAWAGYPIAAGWPVILPGRVTGTPTPADIDGDGDLELLVPCMHSDVERLVKPAHPRPRIERLLFAFHHDGRPVEGWPAVVMDRERRIESRKTLEDSEAWGSNPSVADYDNDGRDEVVIMDHTGVVAIEHEKGGPKVTRLIPFGDGRHGSAPLIDIDRDGKMDVILGDVNISIDQQLLREWPRHRKLEGGYSPAIADADGDGRFEIYHPFGMDKGTVGGFDSRGYALPGWPRRVGRQVRSAPSLADVAGDSRLEVAATDELNHVLVWTYDGHPLPFTQTIGDLTGVFKSNIDASLASPTLADLDGDGRAEIIVFDRLTRTLRAWRGDGAGVGDDDGILARLPDADCWGGVSVADLGSDGVLDLFVSHYWVKMQMNGDAAVTNMLPDHAATTAQPTIADVDRDGKADVLFALADGRAFIYQTGTGYSSDKMLWPTPHGNPRRTGSAPARVVAAEPKD